MDLTRPRAGFRSSFTAPFVVVCATVCCFAPADARAQKLTFGADAQAIPAPQGYPVDLAAIPGGTAQLGLSAKQLLSLAKQFSARDKDREQSMQRLLIREVGSQAVRLPAFLIGRHEVTNAQYEAYVRAHPNTVRFPFDWWLEEDLAKHRDAFWKKNKGKRGVSFKPQDYWANNFKDLKWAVPKGREKFPVSYVSFRDAVGYCSWAGMRLPYEAEWQLALQGAGTKPPVWLTGKKWSQADMLQRLGLTSTRDAKKRAIGQCKDSNSVYGICDMLSNVWEWTRSPFLEFDGYKKGLRAVEKARRASLKRGWKPLAEPLWAADKRIVRGGSFNNRGQAGIVFRNNTRMPLSVYQTVDDLGFRVAKSLVPALDTTTLWYRNKFDVKSIDELQLDVPSSREMRRAKTRRLDYEQRGIERWSMDGEIIRSYHMVSFAPVRELRFRNEKEFIAAAAKGKKGAYGIPVAAVFSTEPFQVQQGIRKWADLDADIYAIVYRGKGLPRELQVAMIAGAQELKRNKGLRDTAIKESAKKPKKTKRSRRKKTKKGKKQADKGKKLDWYEVVDRYGVPDEITKSYPRKKPTEITIRPGNLVIPVNKNILIFRKTTGAFDYYAWSEYRKVVRRPNAKSAKPRLKINAEKDRLEYVGGPRAASNAYRFEFRIPIKLATGELGKNWITPETNLETAKRKPSQSRFKASPNKKGGRSNGK